MTDKEEILAAVLSLRDQKDREHAENRLDISNFKKEVRDSLHDVMRAFPDDDFEGHRRAHEVMIEEAQERKALWKELRSHLLKNGAWAVIGVMLSVLYFYWKNGK